MKLSRHRLPSRGKKPDLIIALAGNANVGKSTIFNLLTGLEQVIGNWPGKTVERAEGTLSHQQKTIKIIDLPGIYSFSTYSQEELISRDYIALKHPDVVVNVVDASSLERNLFFTLQLLEMQIPMVIALNLVDMARKKGINVDAAKLAKVLGVPVTETIATRGVGVNEIIYRAIEVAGKEEGVCRSRIKYGAEIEKRIEKLCSVLADADIKYPSRWTAVKLLEGDLEIIKAVKKKNPKVVEAAKILEEEISSVHREPCSTVIASERYAVAAEIAKNVLRVSKPARPSIGERLDSVSMHSVWGYVLLFSVMVSILIFISLFGDWLAQVLRGVFERHNPHMTGFWSELAWNGAVVGFYAALSVMLGFILPFYIILGLLEDSGYLPKIAYLMDRPCHAIGLHGKASMPLLLAFGCNVPACLGCRILENRRDRLIAMFLSTLVPCSARTAVILGLVGAFVGWQWAVGLYAFDFVFILLIGRALNRLLPGTSDGIIMEMPSYRVPSPRTVLKQAWSRFREFVWLALPLIVLGSVVIEALRISNYLIVVSNILSPVTVFWLGLPAFTGILLIFGLLRKEATLVLLITVAGTVNIASVMSPVQIIVFTVVIMLYIPCIATIAVLVKEAGWKNAVIITLAEIGLATLVGGIAFRLLSFVM